ncbi:MAG: PQQ-binding-like beta-propeller repeat protein [Isosphaeraceae bacterium]|nr:PQQ-binding-like beta-propeller repeat protein [Isosphaeraceae bacterium]
MATLEVHGAEGRVERIEVTREHPVLFGSSPNCDIILSGPGVLPFHGRIRWKGKRYKVDASPDAEFLLVNGHKMTASSFRQGDEIQVGPCRIFMLYAADDLPPVDDKTRIQAAPVARAKKAFEDPKWVEDLDQARYSRETAVAAPRTQTASPYSDRPASARRDGGPAKKPAKPALRGWAGLVAAVSGKGRAPGEERILSSPVVIGLAGTLAVLVVVGFGLRAIIARTTATRLFNSAVESVDNGEYRTAIKRFDDFLAANPGDVRSGKARVLRALANVRQFTGATGASWSLALQAEREMVERVGKEEAYRDASTELAELVIRTGEELAERARVSTEPKVLGEAESAVALHAEIAGQAAESLLGRSRLPAKLSEARAAVRKAQLRAAALAEMDEALKAESSAKVYNARDRLVHQYGDLAADRELVARMMKANELIRRAVKFDRSGRPAETVARIEPFVAPTSLVLRGEVGAAPKGVRNATMVYALADGYAYGIEGGTGAPRWQVEVGLAAPFAPQGVPGGTSVLLVDARHGELLRLDAKSGALQWRQQLGSEVADPPLVLGNQLIQATRSGDLLYIDLKSGALQGTVRLHRPLTRTPASDEAGQYLYVLGDQDCLFVVKRDPPECVSVEYLGHAAGSIPCSPARVGRFLVVSENQSLHKGRWRVFVLDEEGEKVRPAQQVELPGWIWGAPPSAGALLWGVSDRGGIGAYALGGYDEKEPIKPVARLNPDARKSGPAFGLTRTERELWVAGGRSARFDLDLEKGALVAARTLPDAGPALAPLQTAGPLVVLTQQATGGPGVALWGVDYQSGSVVWRTVVGSPWPVPFAAASDRGALATIAADGRALTISEETLESGGFIEAALPRPGQSRLPAGRHERLDAEGITVLIPGEQSAFLLARSGSEGEFHRIDLPAPLAARPLFWGRELLVPGGDGRVYLLDPLTGESRAEPYVPPFDRAHLIRWRSPVRLDADTVALADDAGRVRRLTRPTEPRPRLVVSGEVNLGKEIETDPVSTGSSLVLVTADGRIRALAARDLSPAGAWPLEAPLAIPPAAVGGRAFVADKAGHVVAIDAEGQRLWSGTLRGAPAAGPPVLDGDSAWFLASDGSLQRLSMADGTLDDCFALGILPVGGLRQAGKHLVVPVGVGTVRVLKSPSEPRLNQ